MSTLPGLQSPIQFGYDATRGDFAASPVFTLTYDHGTVIHYDGKDYPVPDGIQVDTSSGTYSSSKTVLLRTKADYSDYYSASLTAAGSTTNPMTQMSFTGSADSNLAFHGTLFTVSRKCYALDFGRQQVYKAKRDKLTASTFLTKGFTEALNALGTNSKNEEYFAFFHTWGTHYLSDGIFGGFYTMETSIDDSLFETSSRKTVEGGVQAGFDGIVSSGSLDFNVAYQSSTWLSQNKTSTEVTIWTNGGKPAKTTDEFFKSVFQNPLLLLFFVETNAPTQFRPLSAFCASEEARRSFDQALQKYLDRALRRDGALGSPEPREEGTVYPVRFDCVLTGLISTRANGSRGFLQAFSDASANPKVLRGAASMHDYTKTFNYVTQASLTTPLRQGDHFLVQQSNDGVSRSALMPVGFHTDVRFGAWQDVSFNTPRIAEADCLVVGIIDIPGNGPRGTIQGQQWLNGEMTTVVASSGHANTNFNGDSWIRCESFCMPVARGTKYQVVTAASAGTPGFYAYALPLEGGHALFGAYEARDPGKRYRAETDGMLVAYIDASVTRTGGRASAYVALTTEDLAKVPARAFTSAHFDQGNDRWFPYNAFTAPVEKGSWYQVSYENLGGSAKLILNWVPLLKPLVPESHVAGAAGAPTSALVSHSG